MTERDIFVIKFNIIRSECPNIKIPDQDYILQCPIDVLRSQYDQVVKTIKEERELQDRTHLVNACNEFSKLLFELLDKKIERIDIKQIINTMKNVTLYHIMI